jgi:hypothetical protein
LAYYYLSLIYGLLIDILLRLLPPPPPIPDSQNPQVLSFCSKEKNNFTSMVRTSFCASYDQ